MVDPDGMAELHGIQELKEHALDQEVITDKVALVGDAREQVSLRAEFHDDVGAIHGIHNANQGNHVGMLRGQMVETDLTLLISKLAGI